MAKQNRAGLIQLASRPIIFLVLAFLGTQWVLLGCSYSGRNILYKNKAYNDYYKEKFKATHDAVIALNADSSKKDYRFTLKEFDQISIQYLNIPKELMQQIVLSTGGGGSGGNANSTSAGSGNSSGAAAGTSGSGGLQYRVDVEGNLALPLIGRIHAKGMSLIELRDEIEKIYSRFYTEPKIDIRITTKQALIYGEVGRPGVIPLVKDQTKLSEVIALAGGFTFSARSHKVEVVRPGEIRPQIIWVNFNDLNSLANNKDLIVHADDVIYVETRPLQQFAREAVVVSTILSLASLVFTFILFTRR